MKLKNLLLPGLALGTAALLLLPEKSEAFVLAPWSLSTSQRDFRVFNNFSDTVSNNNQVDDPMFPGYHGAVMAIWKAAVEWGSTLHGDGSGDPHQNFGLGSGGANFDFSFQGEANGPGGVGANTVSANAANGGFTLAVTTSLLSGAGWKMEFFDGDFIWNDGPGTNKPFTHSDIQGIATHEFGHALGLDHSGAGGLPTMVAGTSTNQEVSLRSISNDDINGIQAQYGVKQLNKPTITGLSAVGAVLTITGTQFTATGNEVWFTQAGSGGNGNPVKVLNQTSDTFTITVNIPGNAGKGDVLVKRSGPGNQALSNAFPFDPTLAPPAGPTLSMTIPSSVPSFDVTDTVVTLVGTGFTGTTDVTVDGTPAVNFLFVDDSTMFFTMPLLPTLGSVDVEVTTPNGSATTPIDILEPVDPTLRIVPTSIVQSSGFQVTMGKGLADFFILTTSPDQIATTVPGFYSLDIGNASTTLFTISNKFGNLGGWNQVNFGSLSGLPIGLTVYWQCLWADFDTTYAFPWGTTNVVPTTIIL